MVPYYTGHGGLERVSGETFRQTPGLDPYAYDMYGMDPAAWEQQDIYGQMRAGSDAQRQAEQALAQFESENYEALQNPNAPVLQVTGQWNAEKAKQYEDLKRAAEQGRQQAAQAQAAGREQLQKLGPTKFDTEMQRMLDASKGKSFEEASGPYLDALAKSKGQMQDATGLYGQAARGEGPSAAQSQFQSALDQSNRMAMGRAGSMRGGALNQVSAQRDAAMQAGQNEAQAASQSASLRAQEMQAAMQGYLQGAGQLGQLDQNTINLQQQHAGQMQAQQRFYEDLRQKGYAGQAQMAQAREKEQYAREMAQRGYDINLSNIQHGRQNEFGNAMLGLATGALSGGSQVASSFFGGKKG